MSTPPNVHNPLPVGTVLLLSDGSTVEVVEVQEGPTGRVYKASDGFWHNEDEAHQLAGRAREPNPGAGPRYPHVWVELTDDNPNLILGKVVQGLEELGVPQCEIDAYLEDATSADYLWLLSTTTKWVSTV